MSDGQANANDETPGTPGRRAMLEAVAAQHNRARRGGH